MSHGRLPEELDRIRINVEESINEFLRNETSIDFNDREGWQNFLINQYDTRFNSELARRNLPSFDRHSQQTQTIIILHRQNYISFKLDELLR